MVEKSIDFEEALDRMVASEFDRMDRITLIHPASPKKTAPQKSVKPPPPASSAAGEEWNDIFNDDEKNLISETVRRLKPMPNKDIIVSKIWSLLVETEPEAFYTPEFDGIGKETVPDSAPDDPVPTEPEPPAGT